MDVCVWVEGMNSLVVPLGNVGELPCTVSTCSTIFLVLQDPSCHHFFHFFLLETYLHPPKALPGLGMTIDLSATDWFKNSALL